jgi:hypothetical protein
MPLLPVEAHENTRRTMHHVLHTLAIQVAAVARRNLDTFLPSSALSGLGRVSELAAQHPAFADTAERGARRSA